MEPVNDCELCCAPLSAVSELHLRLLSPPERERHARYRRVEDRRRFALAAALLRLMVARHTGEAPGEIAIDRTCARCGEPHGRPVIGGPGAELGLHASVSHAGELAVVVLTRAAPVGVDVEALGPVPPATLIQEITASGELLYVEDAHGFYRTWTRKEAVLKATGAGLEVAMAKVRVSAPDQPPALLEYDGGALAAAMADLDPAAGYVGALCVLCTGPLRLELCDLTALEDLARMPRAAP